ncbi:hypothetical protein KFK14_02985 [Sphingobium phenoxybenzoativorans]|uniref:Lipoprotein n=1 Tax=Sphingobium phenoxybenzoativorans TaxID=1592790 RepID=A0A975K7X3_9SPHN|nr:hypothetical protein [Sphingobium phenoxybenzoativorans]QUT06450.1 hypothetical protein KFK14_02985 [Sphingobium phenoxybenzoativorans]
MLKPVPYRLRLWSAALALFALSGCTCTTCDLDSPYKPVPEAEKPAGLPKEDVYAVPRKEDGTTPGAEKLNVAALPAIPVAAVLGELNNMVTQLSNMVGQVGGETRTAILNLQTSASQVLNEANYALGDKLQYTFDRLDKQERRIFEDTQALTAQIKSSADLVNAGLLDSAERSLYEADILAWNTSYSLPCRDKPARLVYPTTRKMRIWADAGAPSTEGDNGQGGRSRDLFLPVRGNFLAIGMPIVTVRVGGDGVSRPATVRGLNHNEFTVIPSEETVKELQAISRPTRLFITADLARCTVKKGEALTAQSEVQVEVLPPLTYAIATSITPIASVPSTGEKVFSFYEKGSDSCNDRYRADRIYSLGPPAEAIDWRVSVNNQNGNSYIIRTVGSGPYSVLVEAMIGGKGRDCFLGICNCRGRGWLGYDLYTGYRTRIDTPLPTVTHAPSVPQTSYSFDYKAANIPAEATIKSCTYNSRVIVSEGGQSYILEANEINRTVTGGPSGEFQLKTDTDDSTCKVTADVTIPSTAKLGAAL